MQAGAPSRAKPILAGLRPVIDSNSSPSKRLVQDEREENAGLAQSAGQHRPWRLSRSIPTCCATAAATSLPNRGHDTRALQAWLGHRNIQHAVRYTELAPDRFRDFWRGERHLLEGTSFMRLNELKRTFSGIVGCATVIALVLAGGAAAFLFLYPLAKYSYHYWLG
jgi:hypothetical protein